VPRLSIVIPVLGKTKLLESGLVSVLENRPAESEIVVVLNDAYDDPYELHDEVRFVEAPRKAGFVESANLGIRASQAPIVHLLACGVEVGENWTTAAMPHFQDGRTAAAVPLVLDSRDQGRVVAAGVQYHPGGERRIGARGLPEAAVREGFGPVLGPSVWGGFYRKSALDAVGGFSPHAGDSVADVDLALALGHAGFRAVFEPRCRLYAGTATQTRWGAFRRAMEAEQLFWRNAPIAGWLRSLVAHPWVVAREMLFTLPRPAAGAQLLGRSAACFRMGRYRQYHRQLLQMEQQGDLDSQPAGARSHRFDREHELAAPGEQRCTRDSAGAQTVPAE
jgi:GT2 family glycosyltransferase